MAGNPIDELVVTLTLDPSKFTTAQKSALNNLLQFKQESTKSGKEIEAWGKQVDQAYTLVRNSLLRMLALVTAGAGMVKFTEETTKQAAATGYLAKNLGLTTDQLQIWENMVKRMGGDASSADKALTTLAQGFQDVKLTGQSDIVPVFRTLQALFPDLNLAMMDAAGNLRNVSDVMVDLHKAFERLSGPEAVNFGKRLGFDENFVNLLRQSDADFNKLVESVKKAGVITDQQAKGFQELQKSFDGLEQAIATFSRGILSDFVPDIDSAVKKTTAWVEGINTALELTRFINQQFPTTNAVNEMNNKLGVMVDPVSGAVIPFGAGGGGSLSIFNMIQRLENSGSGAISPKGAIGRNQIMPDTARQYGFDPSRLNESAYNDMVARAIESDLYTRFRGDPEAIAVGYHSGPGAAEQYLASGRNPAVLGPEGRDYLAREQALTGNSTQSISIGQVIINSNASDGAGIARDFKAGLASHDSLVTQGNTGPQ